MRTCEVADCGSSHYGRGMCVRHWRVWRRWGDTAPRVIRGDDEARLWSKVERGDDCWLYRGNLNTNGYGRARRNGATIAAHRYVYELMVGPIPAGLTLDHLCRTRACCNPAHLEAVTLKENIRRGWRARAADVQIGDDDE